MWPGRPIPGLVSWAIKQWVPRPEMSVGWQTSDLCVDAAALDDETLEINGFGGRVDGVYCVADFGMGTF